MSLIIDAITRISVIAAQRNFANIPGEHIAMSRWIPNSARFANLEDLTEEQLGAVSNYDVPKPRLTLDEIKKLTASCRFSVPQEFIELYQIGNGCLPIGISENKDWDSAYNYFYFPSMHNGFLPLTDVVGIYQQYWIHTAPQILPFARHGPDGLTLCMIGSNESADTAPIVWTYDESINASTSREKVLWPSLTNMMLAYAEYWESQNESTEPEDRAMKIYQKYGGGQEFQPYMYNSIFYP
ncbi:MAG: SMI1/KNR4 family protein [Symploca sp. SIO2B6]|nr:SMI1/KNR4 family protein [Symploca sp. SIO2B6]